jgi:hypothetical protein
MLSPVASFHLSAAWKHHHFHNSRAYLTATKDGLTLGTVANHTSLIWADLDGHVRHVTPDIVSIDAEIYRALPVADGRMWVVAEGPHRLNQDGWLLPPLPSSDVPRGSHTQDEYNQLDLYSPNGDHLSSVRIRSDGPPAEMAIAATADTLVFLRSLGDGHSRTAVVRFGTVADGRFHQTRAVAFEPAFGPTIPLLAGNGKLYLIDPVAGNMMVIDPKAGGGRLLQPMEPHPVTAATVDGDFLYMLSGSDLLQMNSDGAVLTTYHLRLRRTLARHPAIAVTGHSLYVGDGTDLIDRYELP